MANWDRRYNTPTTYNEPYLVDITKPAGWKPTKAAVAGQFPATVIGTPPNETYELPYTYDGTSPASTDTWKLGPVYKGSTERRAKLKVRNLYSTPDPHAYDADKPKLRDGAGGGVEEGTFEVKVGSMVYKGILIRHLPPGLRKKKAKKKAPKKRK